MAGNPSHQVPGFSLNEAARIRARLLLAHEPVACPRCGGELKVLGGAHDGTEMVLCGCCGAGMLLPGVATHAGG